MGNMEVWNKVKQPPAEALKSIIGGRLKGMSNINPQWRYRIMTETFGMCGVGWKYTIDKLWSEPASDGQIFAFAQVSVYVKDGDKWSEPIPGQGGSMLIEKEKAGPHASDEGYKMAITDALSVAMKMLGVAADVYMSLWDGEKYHYSQINGYQEIIDDINACQTMESLQKTFTAAWELVKNDIEGQKIVSEAKDKRKRELSK